MAGTIKDYFPNAQLLGEKSYGKGSVQTLDEYADGSSLKYTIAKWFT
jgi:carboxyl-terminal processing protease